MDDKPRTVRSVLELAMNWLAAACTRSPRQAVSLESVRLEAELLLAHALKKRRLDLYIDRDRPLVEAELAPFRAMLKRRAAGEPLAWITGEREFYGLAFEITRDVLIPRPETEHLVDAGRAELARLAAAGATELAFADVCTGCGCVSVALIAHAPPSTRAFAVDLSRDALAVARKNVEKYGFLARIELLEGDLLAPVRARVAEGAPRPSLIVSNPPYVTPEERAWLAPDVLAEPALALFDSSAELPLTRRLVREAREVLPSGGAIAIETGTGRAAQVEAMLGEAGYVEARTVRDLARIERIVIARAP